MDTKDRLNKTEVLFFLIGGLLFMMPVLYSGRYSDYGLSFWGPNGHDAIFHLALIKQMAMSLSFDNPLLAGTVLHNYHLGFDLVSAIVTRLSGISTYDWYFRVSPVLSTFLLIFVSRGVLIKMGYTTIERLVSISLLLFGGSLGFLVGLIKNGSLFGGESAFWVNQAVSAQLNPPYIWSLVVLLAFIYFYGQSKRKYLYIMAPLILFWIKAYAGILAVGVIFFEAIYVFVKKKKATELYLSVVAGVILLLGIVMTTDGASLITFEPFWFLKNMWSAGDRLGVLKVSQWWNQWERYGDIKLVLLQIISMFIFIFGNLGLRVFFIKSISDFSLNKLVRMLWWLSLLGLLAPMLIIQRATPWNTAQFSYYSLIATSLLAGKYIFEWLYNSRRLPEFALKTLIVSLGFVTSVGTLLDYFSPIPATYIGYYEIDTLSKTSNETRPILSLPYSQKLRNNYSDPKPIYAYESTAYLGIVGSKCSLCDEVNLSIMGYEYKEELNKQKILLGMDENDFSEYLSNKEIFVYIPSSMIDSNLFEKNGLKLISSNQGVSLWKK